MDRNGQSTNLRVIPLRLCSTPTRSPIGRDSHGLLSQTGPSQWITIDMRAPQVVSALIYEPRRTPSRSGAIGQFEVSVSADGVHFETVSTGTWADTTAIKQIGIDAVTTRFVG